MLSGKSHIHGIPVRLANIISALAALDDTAGDAGAVPTTIDVDSKEAKASE
jgi:hypothetical protein